MDRRISFALCLALAAIVLTHIAALHFHWYWTVAWFDIAMHFVGGLWVGLVTLLVFAEGKGSGTAFLYALLGVIIVGLLWELYEYAAGMTFSLTSYPVDTSTDLLMDVIGGVASYFLLRERYTNRASKTLHG